MSEIAMLTERVAMIAHREPIDGRVSWVAATTGFEHYNEYVVLGAETALLIDSGVAKHAPALLDALAPIVGSRNLVVYLTRIELDCIGNLGVLLDAYPKARVVTANPISPVSLVHRKTASPVDVTHLRFGETLAAFGFPDLRVVEPAIRTLGTSWLYDTSTGMLFSSDSFCCDLATRDTDTAVRPAGEVLPSVAALRDGLRAKFDWLARADRQAVMKAWHRAFDPLDVGAIAPIHGRAVVDKAMATALLARYRDAACA